jgi:hypothetical protein
VEIGSLSQLKQMLYFTDENDGSDFNRPFYTGSMDEYYRAKYELKRKIPDTPCMTGFFFSWFFALWYYYETKLLVKFVKLIIPVNEYPDYNFIGMYFLLMLAWKLD